MPRELITRQMPDIWIERRNAGLCPVCGKEPGEFDKNMRVFCSVKCRDEYAGSFKFWSEVRDKILKRDGHRCTICGMNEDDFFKGRDLEEKTLEDNAILEWLKIPANRTLFENIRDQKLIKLAEEYERDYKKIMDDLEFYKTGAKYEIAKHLPDRKDQLDFKRPQRDFFLEVDHITAICNGGAMWDESNLRTVCNRCHVKKTTEDVRAMKFKKKHLTRLEDHEKKEPGDDNDKN